MQAIPSIDRPTGRPNYTVVTIGAVTIYYSYRTPVVFRAPSVGCVARNNVWGPTTGRHIGDAVGRPAPAPSVRFRRMDEDEFTAALRAAIAEEVGA